MPCRDEWAEREAEAERTRKIHDLTRMLCEVCAVIEKHHPDSAIQQSAGAIPGLREWWDKHKEMDRARQEIERKKQEARELRKSALSKLTHEERKALNLP